MRMKFEHLKYFIEVVQCKSINKAAKKLFVSQPTVTSTIKTLENDLGFPLIERSHKGVTLTDKGKRVYEDAKKIVEMEKSWRAMDEREPEIGGDVHVAVVPSATSVVLECISSLKKEIAQINIVIHDGRKFKLLKMMEQNLVRIGIYGYVHEEKNAVDEFAKNNGFIMEEVFFDKLYVYISARHPILYSRSSVKLCDLKSLPVTVYTGEDPMAPYFLEYFNESKCYFVNDLQAMMDIALNGETVVACTKLYAHYSYLVQSGLLKVIKIDDFDIQFNYCLIYPEASKITHTERIVVNKLREEFFRI